MTRSPLRAAALACASVLALAAPALSQPAAPPQISWTGGAHWTPAPTYLIGFDSSSGQPCVVGQTVTCLLDISGSFSATVVGFRPTAYGTPVSATTTSSTQALPAGAQVVATDTGTVGAYCALGPTATLASQYIAPGGGWFNFAINGDTQISCITASGTTTVNTAGGSGLPTGTGGGGGGGGGGGAVTAASGSYASGALALGSIVDIGTGATPGANTVNGRLVSILSALGSPFQAGGAVSITGTPAVKAVDSSGADATDTTNHAFKVNCVIGCGSGPVTQGAGNSSNRWYTSQQDSAGNDATDATNHAVKVNAPLAYNLLNPTVSYPVVATAGGTAYASGSLMWCATTFTIANGTGACTGTFPNFSLPLSAGRITGYHIRINDSTSTAWSQGSQILIKEWSAAPTLAVGDHVAYSLTSGTANWIGDFMCTMNGEEGDGATGYCTPIGPVPELKGVSSVYVAALAYSNTGVTTASGFTITMIPTIEQ